MTERARTHFRVEGRVQGVGFRRFVEIRARVHGLAGWVRNCDDGAVEVLAEGTPDAVAASRGEAQRGPPGARVTRVVDLPDAGHAALPDPFAVYLG